MNAFAIPDTAVDTQCTATAPDLWTVGCELQLGHAGPHRNNMVVWELPARVFVGGIEQDADLESERWQHGQVLLADDVEPTL